MSFHGRLAFFCGSCSVLALSLTVLGCESGGEGTSGSASPTGGHGGEVATGGSGPTGGGGTASQGGSGAEGGQGGSGGTGGGPTPALAERLAGDVWHFESTGGPWPDAAWLRFALTGESDGTVDVLPEG